MTDTVMRIVSLLPSATEILFALGLDEQVVGVTFECLYPDAARSKRIISTTALPEGLAPAEIDAIVKQRMAAGEDLYRLERDALADLRPDLVVTQDLCQVCAVATTSVDEALEVLGIDAHVLTLDPSSLDEVLDSIIATGTATGRQDQASELVASLRARLDEVEERLTGAVRRPALVLEWTDPPFASGHWVPDLVAAGGGVEVLGTRGERSVQVTWDEVRDAAADVALVAPCGYGLEGAVELGQGAIEQAAIDRRADGSGEVEVWAVDADAFVVRPGPRVVDGVELFASILHPDRCGPPDPARAQRLA